MNNEELQTKKKKKKQQTKDDGKPIYIVLTERKESCDAPNPSS